MQLDVTPVHDAPVQSDADSIVKTGMDDQVVDQIETTPCQTSNDMRTVGVFPQADKPHEENNGGNLKINTAEDSKEVTDDVHVIEEEAVTVQSENIETDKETPLMITQYSHIEEMERRFAKLERQLQEKEEQIVSTPTTSKYNGKGYHYHNKYTRTFKGVYRPLIAGCVYRCIPMIRPIHLHVSHTFFILLRWWTLATKSSLLRKQQGW